MTTPNEANAEQSVRNRGIWLAKNEAALKACQAFLVSAFWTVYEEENSADLDQFLLSIEDHVDLFERVISDLRQQQFWPEGTEVNVE